MNKPLTDISTFKLIYDPKNMIIKRIWNSNIITMIFLSLQELTLFGKPVGQLYEMKSPVYINLYSKKNHLWNYIISNEPLFNLMTIEDKKHSSVFRIPQNELLFCHLGCRWGNHLVKIKEMNNTSQLYILMYSHFFYPLFAVLWSIFSFFCVSLFTSIPCSVYSLSSLLCNINVFSFSFSPVFSSLLFYVL